MIGVGKAHWFEPPQCLPHPGGLTDLRVVRSPSRSPSSRVVNAVPSTQPWLSASLPCESLHFRQFLASSLTLHIPSWRAFAPPALPGFFTTTPPLTSAGLLPDRPFADLLALRHLNFPPFHLQPPQGLTRCLFHVTHQALVRVRFPFHSSFAISQQAPVPSEPRVRLLQTGGSPSARSQQFRAGERLPAGTFRAYERSRRTLRGPIRSPYGSGSYLWRVSAATRSTSLQTRSRFPEQIFSMASSLYPRSSSSASRFG